MVYRDLQGTYWYQGLLAVSYTPTVATAADRLAGKVWSVAGDVTNAGHSCPSVQWKQGRQWCFGPTLAYTGSGSLSAVAEVVEPRGTRMTVVSPSFFV